MSNDGNRFERTLDRRALIRRLAAAAGLTTIAGYPALAPEGWPLSRRDSTGLRSKSRPKPVRLKDFTVEKPVPAPDLAVGIGPTPEERLHRALDALGGLQHYVRPGEVVLLKPNVAFGRSPILGATSDPATVEILVRMLLVDCRAAEVRVADNPIENPADCFTRSGIGPAVGRAGGRIILPDDSAFRVLETPGATLIEHWPVFFRPLEGIDRVIGLAPAKDHNLCGASLGLKNWYGLLGGPRNRFHQAIDEIISDLGLMLRPTLTIVDGGRVLMRNGPTGGNPADVRKADALVAGTDPVAVDAWAFEHLLERRGVPSFLVAAEAKGCGRIDFRGRVEVIG